MKEDVTSGLVSRDILEQSEGIVNVCTWNTSVIATLDRRLLTNKKLSTYGIIMIRDADIDESISKKIKVGQEMLYFNHSMKKYQ